MSLRTNLSALEQTGLIRVAQAIPELEYLFRHALVQDAAFASLVKEDRRHLHHLVGETLERLYVDRREELYAVLALHFAAAGETDKAVQYYRQAALRAEAAYAHSEGIQHLLTALDLIEPGQHAETRLALLEQLARLYHLLREGAWAVSIYQSALDLWASLDSPDLLIAMRLHRCLLEAVANMLFGLKYEQMEALSQAAESSRASLIAQLNQGKEPHPERVRAWTALANDAWRAHYPPRWDEAEHYALAAVQMAQEISAPSELSAAFDALASVHYARGRLREHLEVARHRLALSRASGFADLRTQVQILSSASSALVYVGEYSEAMPHALEAESLAGHIRAIEWQVLALGLQSQCWFRLDRWDDMLQIAEKRASLEQMYPHQRVGATCFEIGLAAAVHALRGERDIARILRQQSYDIMTSINGAIANWPRNAYY